MPNWLLRIIAMVMMLGLPLAALLIGAVRLVPFLAMPLFVLGGPMIAALRRSDSEPGAEGDDDGGSDGGGGGGNRRPGRGPSTPSGPTGELPLKHSRQGSWRMRGNGRERMTDPSRRRHPHPAPARRPRRTAAGPHPR